MLEEKGLKSRDHIQVQLTLSLEMLALEVSSAGSREMAPCFHRTWALPWPGLGVRKPPHGEASGLGYVMTGPGDRQSGSTTLGLEGRRPVTGLQDRLLETAVAWWHSLRFSPVRSIFAPIQGREAELGPSLSLRSV